MNEKSNWIVSARGNLFRLGRVGDIPPKIVHLDDHILYAKGISVSCIEPFFPNAIITHFQNGTLAFNKIAMDMRSHIVPDLIISDIAHMGMSGIDFVRAFRALEKEMQRVKPVPIIILSFQALSHPSMQEPGLVNAILEKTADADTIVNAMECALYDRMEAGL